MLSLHCDDSWSYVSIVFSQRRNRRPVVWIEMWNYWERPRKVRMTCQPQTLVLSLVLPNHTLICVPFLVWTIVNIWGMATFYQRGYRRNKMLSTLFATQKHEAIQRTMWALLPWQSKFSSSPYLLLENVTWGTDVIVKTLFKSLLQLMNLFFVLSRPPLFSNCEVLTTLTPDSGRILSKLHAVQPKGKISFCTGIRVAHVCNFKCFRSRKNGHTCLNYWNFI